MDVIELMLVDNELYFKRAMKEMRLPFSVKADEVNSIVLISCVDASVRALPASIKCSAARLSLRASCGSASSISPIRSAAQANRREACSRARRVDKPFCTLNRLVPADRWPKGRESVVWVI